MPTHITPPPPKRRAISLTSPIVVPLKQHLGCCVIVPMLLKTVGSLSVLSSFFVLAPRLHFYIALGLAPLVVWLCLKVEDKIHDWQHRRGHFSADPHHHHVPDCASCAPCPMDHSRPGFRRRYLLNLLIAVILLSAIELFHHHVS